MSSIGPATPDPREFDAAARATYEALHAAEGAGPAWLAFADSSRDVEAKAAALGEDGRLGGADVVRLVEEAKDYGGVNASERAVLADLLVTARDLFDPSAARALAAYLQVPLQPFERPVPGATAATSAAAPTPPTATGGTVGTSPSGGTPAGSAVETRPAFDPLRMPLLRPGSREGGPIRTLQATLNRWRADQGMAAIGVDGGFGRGTKTAVQAFQRAHGLGDDGVVGSSTWEALLAYAEPIMVRPRAAEVFAAAGAGGTNAATARIEQAWSAIPGTTTAATMPGNGGRPVAVHLPPGFDASKPAKVVTMFHGHHWNVGAKLADQGVLERVRQLGAADPQTVFVFPEGGSPPFRSWMRPPGESFTRLHEQALGAAARMGGGSEITVTRRIVDAHSGAGLTLKNAIAAGDLVADKVNVLDAAYGDWGQEIARWATQQPNQPSIESWYTNHGSQAANNRAMANIAPALVTTHAVGSGALHNAVPGRHVGTD